MIRMSIGILLLIIFCCISFTALIVWRIMEEKRTYLEERNSKLIHYITKYQIETLKSRDENRRLRRMVDSYFCKNDTLLKQIRENNKEIERLKNIKCEVNNYIIVNSCDSGDSK